MKLAGIQKLTLLDYPDKTAACVFTPGCNMRCPFCHNADLVVGAVGPEAESTLPSLELDDFFDFLDTRHGLLDGVCISGGEPLLQSGIDDFCREIHERGFLVKLDTNGTNPEKLRTLITEGLVDYVALDVKNSPDRYPQTVGISDFDLSPIRQSIDLLLQENVEHEFRTTVVRELHNDSSLREIARWIKGARMWYLQNFVDSKNVLAGEGILHSYSEKELTDLLPQLQDIVPGTSIRGGTT